MSNLSGTILTSLIISSLPAAIIHYRQQIHSYVSLQGVTIGITECVKIKEKEYLNIDYDTDRMVQRQVKEFHDIVTACYPFHMGQVNVSIIRRPRLFYLFNDLFSLKRNLESLLKPAGFSCILVIIKDVDSRKLHFDAITPAGAFNSISTLNEFAELFDFPVTNEGIYDDYVIAVSKIFLSIIGQSVLDYNISQGRFDIGHRVIDDCKQLFTASMNKVDALLKDDRQAERDTFKRIILCNFERYTAIMYLNQKEYLTAVSCLFSAIKLNPYFPYNDQAEHRDAFNKRYTATVSNAASHFEEAMLNGESEESLVVERTKSLELAKSVDYTSTKDFEHLLKEIILEANSTGVNSKIESSLAKDFIEEPIQHLIRGEVLKYLPLGNAKHDQIYIKRLPSVISEFELLIKKDPEFIITYTRLGALKIIAACYKEGKKKRLASMEEGFETFKLGQEVLLRLGFDVRHKESSTKRFDTPGDFK
jgi:tetratricopeptide (TPR) repeat protein